MIVSIEILLGIDACDSLKQKRGMLKPLLAALHRQFNAAAAEIGHQDEHLQAEIGIAIVGNQARHLQSEADTIISWVEDHWRDGDVIDTKVEIL